MQWNIRGIESERGWGGERERVGGESERGWGGERERVGGRE